MSALVIWIDLSLSMDLTELLCEPLCGRAYKP